MNKRIIVIFVTSFLVAPTVFAKEGFDIKKVIDQQTSDFKISVRILEPTDKKPIRNIAEFVLETSAGDTTVYDMYFYRDSALETIVKSITVPYRFKQNFSGLNAGRYHLKFILIKANGQSGRVEENISVAH